LDVSGSYGNNFLYGGAGNDFLYADYSVGLHRLDGGDGDDYLSAKSSSSRFIINTHILDGGAGNDILDVGSARAKNKLMGGTGDDILIGGLNEDTFVFKNYHEGVDRIYNFDHLDRIQICAVGFGGDLSPDSLSVGQFTLGTVATTNDHLRHKYWSALL